MGRKQNRVEVLVRSEVARWRPWQTPYGASAEETTAMAARRDDYAGRACDALAIIDADEDLMMRCVGVVLREERERQATTLLDVETLVGRVRKLTNPAKGRGRPPCSECVRQGGVRLRCDDASDAMLAVQTSIVGPWLRGGPKEPMCSVHNEEHVYFMALARYETQAACKAAGSADHFHVRHRPYKPTSLLLRKERTW